ncbi:hypothetical protein ABTX81_29195 [Kitasatospora sp. NPDC097605]|uniref:hypothetical protein n=1 Tax=Kitasatospora sp. NPDC097605 TaxID=3157226 RepID=UPI00332A00C4
MRRNRSRLAIAAGVAALVLIGGGLWWWQPWRSADVPASACWGLVTASDLRTLMSDEGKAVEVPTDADLSGRSAKAECYVGWEPVETDPVVKIEVRQADELSYRLTRDDETGRVGQGWDTVLDFGAGVEAWLQDTHASLLLLKCDSGRSARPGAVYRQIRVWGGFLDSDLPTRERTQLFADIARRTAAEVVRQEGCPNVQIADRAPAVAG